MNKKAALTDLQKDSFGLLYYCLKNSVETCEALMKDKQLDGYIRHNFIRLWLITLSKIKSVLDKSLGCNVNFDSQIKNTDTLGLYELVTTYMALPPEGREAMEELTKALKNNQEIKVEVA